MSLNENGMYMPVAPAYGGNGFGNGNCDVWWLFLFWFAMMGNNGWGGFGGNGDLYPWMNQSQQVNDGFRDQMINGNIDSIRTAIADTQLAMSNGFAGVEQAANTRQMANMQNSFAIQGQIAGLGADVAREACADRAAVNDGVRDILANQNAGIQRILDQMCNDKIDAKNEKIADLERQLTMANLAASQNAQTSRILSDNAAQTMALEQYLNPTPIPAYVVQNPNCCPNNACGYNCGCGA